MYINRDFSHFKCEFGIDKVKLFTSEFAVNSILNWHIEPNAKHAGELQIIETPLFGLNGETICGQRAYINKPTYKADIHHNKLFIEFNPSKWFHATQLTADADRIGSVLKTIEADLLEHAATEADLFNGKLSRIDFTAQAEMQKSVPHYDSVIGSGRTIKRAPRKEYPNGFLIGNRARQLCTYDKGFKDLLDSGHKNITATNLLRVETRYLTPKALCAQTLFGSVNDLLSRTPADMHAAYNKARADLLRIDQTQLQFVEIAGLANLIRTAIDSVGKQHALDHLIACLMANEATPPSPNAIKNAVEHLHKEGVLSINVANNWHTRYAKRLRLVQLHSAMFHQQAQRNYIDYHKEFTDKFILPYAI